MTTSLGYSGAKSGYHCHMRHFAFLLRLVILAAFAAGVGLPMQASVPMPAHPAMTMDHAAHQTHLPADEACREHCLGVSVLVAPVVALRPMGAVVPVHHAVIQLCAASLWPQPQGRPPRI